MIEIDFDSPGRGWQSLDMTPEAALERQIEIYRAMTGEQRLEIALNLHELSCEMAREGIRGQHPGATSEEVEEHLKARLRLARSE